MFSITVKWSTAHKTCDVFCSVTTQLTSVWCTVVLQEWAERTEEKQWELVRMEITSLYSPSTRGKRRRQGR